jgi:hypothetical protein
MVFIPHFRWFNIFWFQVSSNESFSRTSTAFLHRIESVEQFLVRMYFEIDTFDC